MGEEVRSDFALSIQVLHRILGHLDNEWTKARTSAGRQAVVEIAIFLVVAFGLGLRGEEVVKMDIAGFLKYFEAGRDHLSPHVMIPLLGRFKGETGERWHLLPIVWKTRSGIEAGTWASRLVESLLERNRRHGFVFADKKGKPLTWYIDVAFAVHGDMKSHTGAVFTMGKGAIIGSSTKQKVNSRSSTESELIGVDDKIAKVL
jgi:hypothetical protein